MKRPNIIVLPSHGQSTSELRAVLRAIKKAPTVAEERILAMAERHIRMMITGDNCQPDIRDIIRLEIATIRLQRASFDERRKRAGLAPKFRLPLVPNTSTILRDAYARLYKA